MQGHLVEHSSAGCIVLGLHGVYIACQIGVIIIVNVIVHANAIRRQSHVESRLQFWIIHVVFHIERLLTAADTWEISSLLTMRLLTA